MQAQHIDAHAGVGVGIQFGEMPGKQIHLRLRTGQRNLRLEARDDEEKMTAAITQLRGTQSHGRPELIVRIGKAKSWRHYSDDRVALSIEKNLFAEYLKIGSEAALPQIVANDYDVRVARPVLLRDKDATKGSLDAQCAEKFRSDQLSFHPNRLALTAEIETAVTVRGHALEDSVLTHPVGEIPRRGLIFLILIIRQANVFINHDETIGLRIRQSFEQDRIDDREDGGVCANTQGQRQNGDERETGVLAQHASGVAQILQKFFEPTRAPLVAADL